MDQRPLDNDDLAAIAEAVSTAYGVSFDIEKSRSVADALGLFVEVDNYAEGFSASRVVEPWGKDQ